MQLHYLEAHSAPESRSFFVGHGYARTRLPVAQDVGQEAGGRRTRSPFPNDLRRHAFSDTIGERSAAHLVVERDALTQPAYLEQLANTADNSHTVWSAAPLGDSARRLQLLGGLLVCEIGCRHCEAGPDDDLVSEGASFGGVDQRSDPASDHV
jgi:hypothetical protein